MKKLAMQTRNRSVTSPGTSQTNDIVLFADNTGQVIKTSSVRMVDGVIIDPVQIDSCFVTALADVVQTVEIDGNGVLNIDMTLGNVVTFDHDEDITLEFTNIPSTGIAYIYLIRQKDSSATARIIDWAGSTADFFASGGEEPELTQEADAVDTLLLETRNGGFSFYVALKVKNALPLSTNKN